MSSTPRPSIGDVPKLADHEILAFRAFLKGDANNTQQKIVLGFITTRYAMNTYSPQPSDSAFLQGQRHMGRCILQATEVMTTSEKTEADRNKLPQKTG